MTGKIELADLIEGLCLRPGMYVGSNRLDLVCAYLHGYSAGASDSVFATRSAAFSALVSAHTDAPRNVVWSSALLMAYGDSEAGFQALLQLVRTFLADAEVMSEADQIERYAQLMEADARHPAVAQYRRFMIATLYGDEATIRELILPHDNADVLWAAAYPNDAAALLEQVWRNMHITRLRRADAPATEVVVCSEAVPFPMTVVETGATWLVDAGPLIEARLAAAADPGTPPSDER